MTLRIMPQAADQLREKRVELILQQLEQLPTLPAVALRVLQVASNQETSTAEVVKLISSDQSLTARILQLVHRAHKGVRSEITSLERAVTLLGFEAVRSAALAVTIFQTLGSDIKPRSSFSREEFWKHSIAVACCAEVLAEPAKLDAGEAFVCGLLHDIGKVALDAVLPKSFGKVVDAVEVLRGNIADLERTVIGLDHMVVGKRLAEQWSLPATIRDCIWLHGQLPRALPATVKNPRMVNLITLCDILVRQQHLGYSGNFTFGISKQVLAEALGLSVQLIDDASQRLVAEIEARAASLGLGKSSSSELYQQALSQANKELGQLSGQLAARNRKLAIRAKFFDALAEFQGELRADAPPQSVLRAIGQTAVGVLEATSAAAFSLPPGQGFSETLLFDGNGEMFQTALIDCPARPEKPMTGDGPVLSAGAELEWILSAISPRLGGDERFWICLEADGQCIGGVVWGAPGGEAERLAPQIKELTAIAAGWSLALRTAQIREEARTLSEQLADSNRQLQDAQSQLLRSHMMVSVGELAAGAAHEMNNPLTVISGRSQVLASKLSDPKLKAAADSIVDNAHRLSQIISDLMEFAKPVPAKPELADLADLIGKAVYEAKLRSDQTDTKIELTMGEIPPVMVDKRQITDVLIEVLNNALHATEALNRQIQIHGAFDAVLQRVVVTIADNGCGMDEETLKRAFDPFFSAKAAGRRRGLGLPKALRWVESSGGTMNLESRVEQGTQVRILLPAAPATASASSAADRKAAQ